MKYINNKYSNNRIQPFFSSFISEWMSLADDGDETRVRYLCAARFVCSLSLSFISSRNFIHSTFYSTLMLLLATVPISSASISVYVRQTKSGKYVLHIVCTLCYALFVIHLCIMCAVYCISSRDVQ